MLTALRIKNLALVADLTLEPRAGYNVVTGETGAGKSILIGALNLVLGERADRTLIRDGADACSVEAVFDVRGLRAPLEAFLDGNGLERCEDGQLVVKRVVTAGGSNRQFVNGSPTTLAALVSIGEWLVDIHGPHDHQSLLHPSKQLAILDLFGGLEPQRESFGQLARRRAALRAEKAALITDEAAYQRQLDLVRFQVNEITAAGLRAGEDEEVEREHQRASNAAKLLQLSQSILELIAESESSMAAQAGVTGRLLHELQRVDPGAAALVSLHEQMVGAVRELQSGVSRYADGVNLDPARLQELEERLNAIHSLKRKYGGTLAAVLTFRDEAREKLQLMERRDAELARLNAELAKVDADLVRAGRELSVGRRKAIPRLSKAVSRELADLGFKQSRFDVLLSSVGPDADRAEGGPFAGDEVSASGFDAVEYQFAPNPGEPARPLRAIASSGELARVMLALKTVLAAEDDIPVLVFDEVDANVGGETANAVGAKMRRIASKRQVLCVTHLPQVAAPAATHYVVGKRVSAGRTISEIRRIEGADRVDELARMLGGQTVAARKHAEALLDEGTPNTER